MIILSINVMVAILITSITGAILFLVWYFFGKILERLGFTNIVFELLKMVTVFFLFPISYLFLKVFEFEIGRGYLFQPSPFIMKMSFAFVLLWAAGVLLFLIKLAKDVQRLHRRYGNAISCDRETQKVFEKVKTDMGIFPKRLQVMECYSAEVPCVTGIWKQMIILPVEHYSEEELYIILTHEMMHYKQKDVLLKRVSYIVLAIHFFNPFAWLLVLKIQKWSEYGCDYKACEQVGSIKTYFETIASIMTEKSGKTCLTSQLMENRHELVERVEKMKKLSKMKRCSKLSAALVLCIAFMTSSMSVYGMTMGGAEAYIALEERTSVEIEAEPKEETEYVVYTESGNTADITMIEGELNQQTRSTSNINWEVADNTRVYGPYFSCVAEGEVIVALAIRPDDVDVKVGIEDAAGTRTYVVGKKIVSFTFDIEKTGEYRFFVENTSGEDVSVEGSYIVY